MEKQHCPHCRTLHVWYWGWYERKEGKIPYGDGEAPSGAIPIRRFYCPKCRRTFSWRPRFLVFGRTFAAVAYQQAFKKWALGHSSSWKQRESSWYQLELSTYKAFCQRLNSTCTVLNEQLREELRLCLMPDSSREKEDTYTSRAAASGRDNERRTLWHLTRRLAQTLAGHDSLPRFSCHFLFTAMACHSFGV